MCLSRLRGCVYIEKTGSSKSMFSKVRVFWQTPSYERRTWASTVLAERLQISVRTLRRKQLLAGRAIGALRWIGAPLLILAFCVAVGAVDSPLVVPIRVDHHIHLNSLVIQAFLPEFCASTRRSGKCDPALTTPHSVEDLRAAMARAGIQRALVVSNGYRAESPMMESQRADGADLMRAANDGRCSSPVAIRNSFPPSSQSIPFALPLA